VLVWYDSQADLIYAEFTFPEGKVYGARLDERRILRRDEAGAVVGVEFLAASGGLNLEGMPQAERIIEEIRRFREVTAELESAAATS